jgi:DNA-binding MarR family transcriptional regulator
MKNIDTFLKFAESLKLVRKPRIEDYVNDKTIDDIYTDLLPNNGIINKLNLPRTTILVGRKGTGKSTIFQKSQKDLIENNKCISIYIDVKTLYDNSSPSIPGSDIELNEELKKYLLYSSLIEKIVIETKDRLDDFVKVSIFKKILGFDLEQIEQLKHELNTIESSIKDVIKTVDGSLIRNFKQSTVQSTSGKKSAGLSISKTPSLDLGLEKNDSQTNTNEFETTLITYLDIKGSLISKLTRIKEILEIDHLYIFLDDYSEIDIEAQKIFMDWFIAPLNNLSNDFIKFKIAVYPHRFYYGKLDNAKIDEISLEFFDAFYSFEKKVDISKMESLALDYTKRLIEKRAKIFFPENHWINFFEIEEKNLFEILFSVSFNNPRKIGYILSYCYESCLIHGLTISKEAIENASKRYYTDIIEKYFLANQFVSKPFNDKISNEFQYELLNQIIKKQQINSSTANRARVKGKPSNLLVVNKEISSLLANLELNGFITTYNNTNDNNEQLSVIYSLDYGLCKVKGLNFERASNKKMIDYFNHARFNMNILISDYFNTTQIIKCNNNHEFPYDMLATLKRYKMRCPDCMDQNISGFCEVTLSNVELKEELNSLESKRFKNFSFLEFQILDYLHTFEKTVSVYKISTSLDKDSITIEKYIHKLVEKDFVKQDIEASRELKKEVYQLTKKGLRVLQSLLKLIKEKVANKV